MNLRVLGLSFRTTSIGLRERLGFTPSTLLLALERANSELACEVVLLSTCNRVEFYLGVRARLCRDPKSLRSFGGEFIPWNLGD